MKKAALSLILCILLLIPPALGNAASNQQFSDLGPNHWAYQAVMQMVDKGILEGFGDGTFRPDDPVTRAQFAKILVLSLGLPLDYSGQQTFVDIPSSDWSYQYVEAAQKYLTGYKNQQDGQLYFKGDEVAVREDMAVAVVMAKGLNTQNADLTVLNSFSDTGSISQSLRNYIAVAVANHIMDGYGNGLFGPQNTLTRAEAAELMYKSGILSDGGDKVAVGDGKDQNNQPSNIFDLKTVKVGDKVAGMTVTEVLNNMEGVDGNTYGIGGIFFSGQATISGTYEVVHEEMYGDDILYLKLDDESLSKIPQFDGENLTEIPIEENGSAIMQRFGEVGTTGKFKIIIDDYYKSFMQEGYGGAKIVKIIELAKDSDSDKTALFEKGYYDYSGIINQNIPIQLSIYPLDNNEIVGSYFYEKYRKEIQLRGRVEDGKITLYEYGEDGSNTGVFEGNINKVDNIEGTWSSSDKKRNYQFKLSLKSELPGTEYGKRYQFIANVSDAQVEEFAEKLRGYIAADAKDKIASLILYPINVNINGKITKITNEEEFISNYNKIFYPEYKSAMANAFTKYMFTNWRGIMFGDGEYNIWFNYYDSVKITAINN